MATVLHPRPRRPDDPAPGSVNIVARWDQLPIVIRPVVSMSDDDLFDFCQANRDLRIERTRDGELIVMPPTGGETGRRNFNLSTALGVWSQSDGTGVGFDSSTGFILPNRAERSPDAAWIKKERWEGIPVEQRERFPAITPDFVVELLSPSDDLRDALAKMDEWMESGVQLGWLIDPFERRVRVYRAGAVAEVLDQPVEISGEPLLPGFVLRLADLW